TVVRETFAFPTCQSVGAWRSSFLLEGRSGVGKSIWASHLSHLQNVPDDLTGVLLLSALHQPSKHQAARSVTLSPSGEASDSTKDASSECREPWREMQFKERKRTNERTKRRITVRERRKCATCRAQLGHRVEHKKQTILVALCLCKFDYVLISML
ncbi:Hypothetical protein, putative, partial [Bodo saltans]